MSSVVDFLIKLHADGTSVVTEARKVSTQLQAIEKRVTSVGSKLRQAFSPSGFGDALMSIPGMQFLTNPYTMIGAGIGAVTKLGAEAEMTATAFTTLVGNEDKAKSILGDIAELAASSPFGKMDLTANAQQMLSFGVSTEKVMPYLRQLGDISGGNKEKLSSLALVMGQVSSAGKLSGQDLLQFINAGFNPLKELQKIDPTKSYVQLQDAMSKGQISAELVAKAIAHATGEGGQFYQMMAKTSHTLEGRWSSVMDALSEVAISLFQEIQPYLHKFLDFAETLLPYLAKGAMAVFRAIKGVISFIKEWWMELALVASIIGVVTFALTAKTIAITALAGGLKVVALATKVWTGAQWLLNAAMTANPIGLIIVGIAALTAGIVYCWNRFAGFRAFIITMWDTMKQFGSIIKDYILDRITGLIKGVGQVGQVLAKLFSGDFSGAWDTAKDAFANISGAKALSNAIGKGKEVIGGVQGKWQETYAKEQAKERKGAKDKDSSSLITGITSPSLKGSAPMGEIAFGEGRGKDGKKGAASKTGEAIATGGTRSTTIHISIGKLIESQHISMLDKANPEELERAVLQAINRSIALATSSE